MLKCLLHASACGLAAAMAGLGLTSCSKPNPPLLSSQSEARLHALPGGDPFTPPPSASSETLILVGEALRSEAQQTMRVSIRSFWPPGVTSGPGHLFPGYGAPINACEPKADDGMVCSFYVPPLSSPAGPNGAAFFQPISVGLAIDPGGALGAVPRDPRPLPEAGPVSSRQDIDGAMPLGVLGVRQVNCRADLSSGGHWERHFCRLEYGPYLLYVSHDAVVTARKFNAVSDDAQLVLEIRDAGRLLVGMLSSSPSLRRALPPVQHEIGLEDMISAASAHSSSGDTVTQLFRDAGRLMDDSSSQKLIAQIDRNGPRIAWHEARSQSDFDLLCQKAAELKEPMSILSLSPGVVAAPLLYADASVPMADKSLMVVTQSAVDGRPDLWAAAFMHDIGADPNVPAALTITDRPKMKGGACAVGKLYQSNVGNAAKS